MAKAVSSRILTVMFIDIVGYTKKTTTLSREQFANLHDTFDDTALPLFANWNGTVIKKIGDAYLVTFASPTNAVHCGIELDKAFAAKKIPIRVALHTGEVLERAGDVYGDAVNVASRIESVAHAGHIVFSEAVYSAMNKNEIPILSLGAKTFKGVEHPMKLYRVRTRADEHRRQMRMITGIIGRIILFAFIAAVLYVFIVFVVPQLQLSGLN
jgi:adenylate cyclase